MAKLNLKVVIASSLFAAGLLVSFQNFSTDSNAGSVPPTSAPRSLPSGFWGVNIENAYGQDFSWTDSEVVNAIQQTGMQTLRIPGGDFANYWDWKTGLVWPATASDPGNSGYGPPSPPDTLSLAKLLMNKLGAGANPLYVLNVMTYNNATLLCSGDVDDPSKLATCLKPAMTYQIDMLKNAKAAGLPVQNLELGNEFFWQTSDQADAFPTATDYAKEMNEWISTLNQSYSGVRLGVVGSIPAPYSNVAKETADWNAAVLKDLKGAQALTLHRYDGIVDGGVYDPETADQALGYVFQDWTSIVDGQINPIKNAGLETWVTEFGGFSDCTKMSRLSGTWAEGLYQAEMALQFLANADVTMIQLYNVTGSTSSLYFQNSHTYWNGCTGTTFPFEGASGQLTATGQAYALISKALAGATSVAQLNLPVQKHYPTQPPGGWPTPGYPSATGILIASAKVTQWLMINFVEAPLTLSYSGMGKGSIETLSYPALTTSVKTDSGYTHLEPEPFNGSSFTLPAYSISRISVPVN
jgi:hypothetical protein